MVGAKPTIRDVARLAGVSAATVSAVINGTAVVSSVRSERVRDAMRILDYHPDQVARSLRVGKTLVIGMVIPDIRNPFYPEVVRGVEEVAQESGYSVLLCNTSEEPAMEDRHLSNLFSKRVDGVLLACSDASSAYESLVRGRFPIVFVDRIPREFACASVSTDNADACRTAVRHLIDLGHTRIAIATGSLRLSTHAERLEGFRMAMQEVNLPIRSEYLCRGGLDVESGGKLGRQLLRLPAPPTAVICTNNRMLLGVMKAISEENLRCPEQVSVVGFDDFVWTEYFTPPLTVIAQPAVDIGRRATEMLIRRMSAEAPLPPEQLFLKAELRIRKSTGPASRGIDDSF
jgi:LacI family transcriptional regulator